MRCSCGRELSDKAKFCPSCGQPVERIPEAAVEEDRFICRECGAKLRPTAKFCGKCGALVVPGGSGKSVETKREAIIPARETEIPVTVKKKPTLSAEDEWFTQMPPL